MAVTTRVEMSNAKKPGQLKPMRYPSRPPSTAHPSTKVVTGMKRLGRRHFRCHSLPKKIDMKGSPRTWPIRNPIPAPIKAAITAPMMAGPCALIHEESSCDYCEFGSRRKPSPAHHQQDAGFDSRTGLPHSQAPDWAYATF